LFGVCYPFFAAIFFPGMIFGTKNDQNCGQKNPK